jgi:hypothetical protein
MLSVATFVGAFVSIVVTVGESNVNFACKPVPTAAFTVTASTTSARLFLPVPIEPMIDPAKHSSVVDELHIVVSHVRYSSEAVGE